ncbi:MAG TPA: hypothetical protein VMD30_05040 [Tepidisphaeraceae bacterium]|nr:hypothetical protein [Tepidisphaeraceae bacterium]
MAKSVAQISDCLVLGEHPASYLAAALLRQAGDLNVLQVAPTGSSFADRLVMINPAFLELHPLLQKLRKKIDLSPLYGLTYLCDDGATRAEYHSKCIVAYVASFRQLRDEIADAARRCGVQMVGKKEVSVYRLHENGIDLSLGKNQQQTRALIIGDGVSAELSKTLGFNGSGAPPVIHRFTFARLAPGCGPDLGSRPAAPICLQLGNETCWAWLLTLGKWAQVAVNQPTDSLAARPPEHLLKKWIAILRQQKFLPAGAEFPLEKIRSIDLSLAGALEHEGVGNRTLLIGPAGGFYAASTEDIYPNCWSSLFAADALADALRQRHLQDALNTYRSSWRTTLGDYLRGPSVNLKYLLPLIYRNPVMTERISESLLMGKGVVR